MTGRSARVLIALLALAPVAGCGTLPHPFEGRPGLEGRRLAVPPPARLDIPAPTAALLAPDAAQRFAGDVSATLLAQEVPAVAQPTRRGDWSLAIAASARGQQVVPVYSVLNPAGAVRGRIDGVPVPLDAWRDGDRAELARAADDCATKVASLLTGIQAAQMQADPASLMNRPARIYFAGVSGAPGDGDVSLARQMAVSLPDGGDVIQSTPKGADYTLHGQVTVTHRNAATDHVEIFWTVKSAAGGEAGKVAQINDVPAHTLDTFWGDVAVVVANEAAGGIREVITNYSGRDHKPLVQPAAARAAGAAPTGRGR